jgi:hypothetical protein
MFAEKAAAKGLPFLIIGGNAVIAYGYPRQTQDFDFLVSETDRRAWDELITSLGYRQHSIQKVFHMYTPLERGQPPVDLMLVNSRTFEKLSAGATISEVDGQQIYYPSLLHLIALKLHALRSGLEHRRARDFGDVVELMMINRLSLAAPEFQEILERYGTPAITAELRIRLAGTSSTG